MNLSLYTDQEEQWKSIGGKIGSEVLLRLVGLEKVGNHN